MKKNWEHVGGGTLIRGGGKFPSDDVYENVNTWERVEVRCTTDAHFCMPNRIRRPSDLKKRAGVGKITYLKEET